MHNVSSAICFVIGAMVWLITNSQASIGQSSNCTGNDDWWGNGQKCIHPTELVYPSEGGATANCNQEYTTSGAVVCIGTCTGYNEWSSASSAVCIVDATRKCKNPNGTITIETHKVNVKCGGPQGSPWACQCVYSIAIPVQTGTETVCDCTDAPRGS